MAEAKHVPVWRRELLRGAVIFGAIVLVGMTGIHVARTIAGEWVGIAKWLGPLAWSDGEEGEWEESFRWAGPLARGDRVYVRNINGPIVVDAAQGESLFVVVEKRWRHSDPDIVRIDVVRHAGGVTMCALWQARDASCGPEGEYQLSNPQDNDVAVQFRVYVPPDAAVDLSTVNGGVAIDGVSGPVLARTVNGTVDAVVRSAPFSARTVNGSVDVLVQRLPGAAAGDIALQTVNGSVSAEVAPGVGAEIELSTMTGSIDSDLSLADVSVGTRRLRGRLGSGGPLLRLQTVNGSIHLTHAMTDHRPGMGSPARLPEPPAAPAAPSAPRTPQRGSRALPGSPHIAEPWGTPER